MKKKKEKTLIYKCVFIYNMYTYIYIYNIYNIYNI